MSRSLSALILLTISFCEIALPPRADAQTAFGTVTGQVTDETGGALPGATVALRAASGERQRVAVTDSAGRFTLEQLAPAPYRLTVDLAGFNTLTREAVAVTAGGVVRLTLSMSVSGIAEAVVVRGTAANFASSIAGKRAAEGVVDMFSADEVGRLPDKNIGETLNRIPGVSMLLEKGEGRFIQIRGISPRLNNVTINGLSLGNGETESGGRLLPLDVIGGELLSGVQVLKTPTPDMDGQGIGGTLNLTTKQPFDFDRLTALISSRGGLETISSIDPDDTKEAPYLMDATLAGRLAGGKLGWLAGSSFSNRKTPLLGLFNDLWRPVSLGGNSITYPTNVKNNVTVTARERVNGNAAIDFQPRPGSKFFARTFLARWDELQLRNRYDEGLGDQLLAITGPNSGVISANRVQVNLRSEPTLKKLQSFTLGGTHAAGRWSVDYTGQRNVNSVDEPNDNWEFRSGASTFGPDTFTIDGHGAITITSPGRDRRDPSFQVFRRLRYYQQLTDEKSWAGAANIRRETTFGTLPGYVKAGVKVTSSSRTTGISQETYNIGSLNWTAAESPALTRGGFTNPVPLLDVPNIWLDLDGLNSFFQSRRGDPRYFVLDPIDTYRSEFQSDFELDEVVTAGYLMAKAEFDRMSVAGGVRIERTAVDSSAFTMVSQGASLTARPISGSGDYTNVLPSIVSTFDLGHDVVARAAWTASLGRPEFDALAPRSQLGIEDNPTIGTIGTLTIGNPDLKARKSNNFDASVEWYFRAGAIVSVAAFRKNITNEIIPAPTTQEANVTFQGRTFDRFDTNTTVNAEKAHVHGAELMFADRLRFLPSAVQGFGIGASVTFIGSGVKVARGAEVLTLPLLQQANRSASFTVYYQRGPWDLSSTYKYNSNFLTDYGDARALDLDQGGFGRWDARAQYDVRRDLKLNVSVINLNDRPTREFQGGMPTQITEHEYTGRTILIGFSARLGF